MWPWEMKRNCWEIARWGHLPMSNAKLSVGSIMHVSWPAIDIPSIGYPNKFNSPSLVFFFLEFWFFCSALFWELGVSFVLIDSIFNWRFSKQTANFFRIQRLMLSSYLLNGGSRLEGRSRGRIGGQFVELVNKIKV